MRIMRSKDGGDKITMERPFKEYELPVTKMKVGVFNYYLHADNDTMKSIALKSTKVDAEGKVLSMDLSYQVEKDNEAVLRATKYIKDGEEQLSVDPDTIGKLPEDDFRFLLGKVPKGKGSESTTEPSGDTSKPRPKKGE